MSIVQVHTRESIPNTPPRLGNGQRSRGATYAPGRPTMATLRPAQCSAMSTNDGGNPECMFTDGILLPGVTAENAEAEAAKVAANKPKNFMVLSSS